MLDAVYSPRPSRARLERTLRLYMVTPALPRPLAAGCRGMGSIWREQDVCDSHGSSVADEHRMSTLFERPSVPEDSTKLDKW